MLDEVIITETPPLYSCYGRSGRQVGVPVTGSRSKRILHAALNIETGDLLLLITEAWDALTHQYFLAMIRRHWRGWHLILFEDRGSPHTAEDSLDAAAAMAIEVRLLPRACPELNAADHLFRAVKGRALANRQTQTIDASADGACRYLYALSRQERLVKAGVLSENFWLAP
jgi:transposase